MKKEDFKIEIIEKTYQNGDRKFFPTIYTEMPNLNKFETFCNKFVPNFYETTIKQRYELDCYKLTNKAEYTCLYTLKPVPSLNERRMSFNSYKHSVDVSIDAIDAYLNKIGSTTVIDTKIHKPTT